MCGEGLELILQLRQLTDGLVANNNRDGSAVNEVIANSWGPAGDSQSAYSTYLGVSCSTILAVHKENFQPALPLQLS